MRISNYGIELISMTESDLENVRRWRNQPEVSDFMFYQEEISPERQQNWFNSLDETSVYLMIVHNEEKVGVINVKNINWRKRTGEAGIYIGENSHRNSPVSMQAIFAMMDAFFYEFNFKALKARVKSSNENAIDFNEQLGYKVLSQNGNELNMEVYRSPYTEARTKFIIVLGKYCLTDPAIDLTDAERSYFK